MILLSMRLLPLPDVVVQAVFIVSMIILDIYLLYRAVNKGKNDE